MSYYKLELLIDGKWTPGTSGVSEPVFDPATDEILGELPHASAADLDAALSASQRGFAVWRETTAEKRQAIMEKAARLIERDRDAIAINLTKEIGKPLFEAKVEVDFCVAVLRWYGEEGKRAYGRLVPPRYAGMRQLVVKEPIGPVAAFVAWNFPGTNAMRKIAAALAAGCSIIIKPSEETPATCIAFARCFQEAGLPDGVLNVVFGIPDMVSRHLLASPIVRKVTFTGSVPVGIHLQKLAADTLKRCTMELGGHGPVLVFDDVDAAKVARLAVGVKYRNAGQVCISPTRFTVHDDIVDQFTTQFVEAAAMIKVGNGLEADTTMGPLAGARRIAVIQEFVDDAVACGGRLVLGGMRLGNQGNFYPPTVLRDVPKTARIMNEEPFGPVAIISSFASDEEAFAEANRLDFGLAAYAFTADIGRAARLADRVEAGMVAINSFLVSTPETPFGGINSSGYGSEGGIEGLDAYLRVKFVTESAA